MSGFRRILKFRLLPISVTEIETADEPRFLAVGAQGKDIVVWAEATVGKGVRTCLVGVMTGQMPPLDGEYIGTATQSSGIVVHAYWRTWP